MCLPVSHPHFVHTSPMHLLRVVTLLHLIQSQWRDSACVLNHVHVCELVGRVRAGRHQVETNRVLQQQGRVWSDWVEEPTGHHVRARWRLRDDARRDGRRRRHAAAETGGNGLCRLSPTLPGLQHRLRRASLRRQGTQRLIPDITTPARYATSHTWHHYAGKVRNVSKLASLRRQGTQRLIPGALD